MIIDEALAGIRPAWISKREWNRINEARYRARKFSFSPSASRLAGTFAIGSGDLVIAHRQFARAPYPDTYVEIDSREYYKGAPLRYPTSIDSDRKTGYLITGNRVYGFAEAIVADKEDSGLTPWFYNIVPPGQLSPWRSLGPMPQISRRQQLALMLGSSYMTDEAQYAAEQMLEEVSVHYLYDPTQINSDPVERFFAQGYLNFAGDVRNVWALMLWINQPTRTRFVDEPATRRMHRGKLTSYAAHRVVEIELGRIRTVRRAFLLDAKRLPPRGHEIRGYWQHHGGDKQCSHQWSLLPDEKDIFHCDQCGRLRWWNKETVRGDAARGWVSKEYELKWKGRWEERHLLKKEPEHHG